MNPTVSVKAATQLTIFLPNTPGTLARVCGGLAREKINISALSTDTGGFFGSPQSETLVRMVVSDSPKALRLLEEDGLLPVEAEVLTIEIQNEPGVLAKIAEQLAKAQVNIEYAYLAGSTDGGKGLIILRPSNVERAQRALLDL